MTNLRIFLKYFLPGWVIGFLSFLVFCGVVDLLFLAVSWILTTVGPIPLLIAAGIIGSGLYSGYRALFTMGRIP